MDPTLLLIIGGLGLAGCLALLFLGFNMLRDERKASQTPKPAETKPNTTDGIEKSAPAPDAAVTPPASGAGTGGIARRTAGMMARMLGGGASGSAHEVLRVLRDNLTGRVVIELSGERFTALADVQDPELRQALLTTLTDLGEFFDLSAAGPVEALRRAQPPPATPSASVERQTPPAPLTNSAPAIRAAGKEAPPLPRPTMNPFKQMAVLREMSKNPPPPTATIAEQIDAVLQEHIRGTALRERGIRMRPGPRGDAVFDLDGTSYTGVEELPDEAVRAVVRAAIAEWEAKQ